MINNSDGKTLMIGPSHCVRMAHAIETNQIPSSKNFFVFGKGGLPVWHKDIFSYDFSSFDKTFILVGDFRFGNEIYNSSNVDFSYILNMRLGHRNITKKNISVKCDAFMYGLNIFSIRNIINRSDNVKIIFWDLLGREFLNRRSNKYTFYGFYNHPAWNLSDVEEIFSNRVVSLSSLVCVDGLSSLFIDSNLHPSLMGYLFLNYIVGGRSAFESFYLAKHNLGLFFSKLYSSKKKIYFFGDSRLIKFLQEFEKTSSISTPKTWIFLKGLDEAKVLLESGEKVVEVSGFGYRVKQNSKTFEHKMSLINDRMEELKGLGDYSIIFYESWAYEAISSRGKKESLYSSPQLDMTYASIKSKLPPVVLCPNIIPCSLRDSCLELNVKLIPTQKFIYLLYLITLDCYVDSEDSNNYDSLLAEIFCL